MLYIASPFSREFGFALKTAADYDEAVLYPEELALVSGNAIAKRRIEFCLGRAAAHSALRQININDFPVRKGPDNEPLWPPGVAGAITHSGEFALAAVTRQENAAGIGIDIELIDETVPAGLEKYICTKQEMVWVTREKSRLPERLLMIFSAKESAFKALFPLTRTFLDYAAAELVWREDTRSFSGKLLTPAGEAYNAGYIFEVGCRIVGQYIFTFMKLPPL
ncbi:enterobactin synthetase component d signature [Lucifera butyrica]|uniref:Enterobactin synthetase component d signature n=1 Tax=Lucifera butyrica TaxID=1351585 RepID=A0A498R0Z7_9FIRM|nr:4'-phosphopantetheinyl transferase superfamily protein [Lucifera butyrica]VBB05114.1 enterobactin synthetase component d signature [Lucifera butyrica]